MLFFQRVESFRRFFFFFFVFLLPLCVKVVRTSAKNELPNFPSKAWRACRSRVTQTCIKYAVIYPKGEGGVCLLSRRAYATHLLGSTVPS